MISLVKRFPSALTKRSTGSSPCHRQTENSNAVSLGEARKLLRLAAPECSSIDKRSVRRAPPDWRHDRLTCRLARGARRRSFKFYSSSPSRQLVIERGTSLKPIALDGWRLQIPPLARPSPMSTMRETHRPSTGLYPTAAAPAKQCRPLSRSRYPASPAVDGLLSRTVNPAQRP